MTNPIGQSLDKRYEEDDPKSLNIAPVIEARLLVDATLAAALNLAGFQNAVPFLKALTVVNNTAENYIELDLTIASVPAFLKPKIWRIDAVAAGKPYSIVELDIELEGALLSRLTESESASVTFCLRQRQTAKELFRLEKTIWLLPRNHWSGIADFPDLVAAFVQPNDPAIDRLLKQTSDVLRKNGKNSALDGYSGGAKRAWEIASGIWSAVAAMGLDYALPPASFEHAGQKVRGPTQIAESGLATCFDLTLLFCAAMEQAGLNPLLVFTKGHAFAGVWLKEETFLGTVTDDITALRKRVKLNELVLFETTIVAKRPGHAFSYATQLGAKQISQEKEGDFELAVDIRRARLKRIKPLASAEVQVRASSIEPTLAPESLFEEAPEFSESASIAEPDPALLNPKDRLVRWQKKLLDLSLRNNLLNFKSRKNSLKLEAPDPGKLEDILADGSALKLLPRPELMEGADPRSLQIHEGRAREDARRAHALDALNRHEVFVGIAANELESRLVDLYRASRLVMQEGGANTLFLALGFLAWTRDDRGQAGQRLKAPLILVPVTLNRKSVRSGFTLTLHDDESRFNPTLIEMLRQDFKLNLGVVEGALAKDNAGLDVAAICLAVSNAIKDIRGWEVTEDVELAMFSFAKYLMWKDLSTRTEQLRQNPVVRHLLDTPRQNYRTPGHEQGIPFPNARRLDIDFAPEKTFCPLPADSSKLSAVMAAVHGKDFVLIGPPGTGKSQTIANLIAQCLAERKRVLFVSEKSAALDVVYRRLREVGLGEFCLELHSSKARKLDVLAQLQRSWDARGTIDSDAWRAEAQRLNRIRNALNVYVERLHHLHANGMSIFKAIGVVTGGHAVPGIALSWAGANAHTTEDMDSLRDTVDRLGSNADDALKILKPTNESGTQLAPHVLAMVEQADWSKSWQNALVESARNVIAVAQNLAGDFAHYSQLLGLPAVSLTGRSCQALALLARILLSAGGCNWSFALRDDATNVSVRLQAALELLIKHREINSQISPLWPESILASCRKGMDLLRQRQSSRGLLSAPWSQATIDELNAGLNLLDQIAQTTATLSVRYTDQVEHLNVNQLLRDWVKAEKTVWPLSWLAKRKIRATLDSYVAGDGAPDVANDIRALVKIRDLRTQVIAVQVAESSGDIWRGVKTKPELVQCALNLQRALLAASNASHWDDAGFESIATGKCGVRLASDLKNLRAVKSIDAEIYALAALGASTSGIWAGQNTNFQRLEGIVQFMIERGQVERSGVLLAPHSLVANGGCGIGFANDFQKLQERAAVERQIFAYDDLPNSTNGLWRGLESNAGEITQVLKLQPAIAKAMSNISNAPNEIALAKRALEHLLRSASRQLAGTPIAHAGTKFQTTLSALLPTLEHFAASATLSETNKKKILELPLKEISLICEAMLRAEARLKSWCAWRNARRQAMALDLAPLVAAIEGNVLGPNTVRRVFDVNYCRWWLNSAVDNEEVIRTFVSVEHEKRIGDFRALDDQFTVLTREWVRAGLCAELPTQDNVSANSEWGVLRHEISKKTRHLPLRELITRISATLTKLTPCLLMSPLSIAQYLATDATMFDLVVFDEASQIPVWDAIGAIARGKQVVMVGDPKQLPPTNFFGRAQADADDEEIENDLESILDECLGANLPVLDLSWHYRSRHESLIAFSNHRYYGGKLVTFPSPVTNDRAVSFHHIKSGIYEKGGAGINKPEAKELVADLVARLKSPDFAMSKLTIGVVTFNSQQQKLIEDLLDDERRKDPSLEPYFAESALEPLFVKNIESVQGDERDIMYFSITFGPAIGGAISMNLGPMNRAGGERRLNVAITRSRHELRIFSSIKSEQMDLSRTQARGVRDLKNFLDFAERGSRALAEVSTASKGDFESPFEQSVAEALGNKGWELDTQVGASSFRIDLAVIHPDARGVYLAAIECDGATYHRSATARDRDKLREQVLRGLGWEVLRVWSTDWWVDAASTLAKLDEKLRLLLESSRIEREKKAAKDAEELALLAATQSKDDEEIAITDVHIANQSGLYRESQPIAREKEARTNAQVRNSPIVSAAIFVESDPKEAVANVSPGCFFDTDYDPTLSCMIAYVIDVEGPVIEKVLTERIARAHGWQRTGARILERVAKLARDTQQFTKEDVGIFYWARKRGPEMPVSFRTVIDGTKRAVDEICMDELVDLARLELIGSGVSHQGTTVAMARRLGIARLSATSGERLSRAVLIAEKLLGI